MRAVDIQCGFCGAASGKPCTDTRTGAPTARPHPSRRYLAELERIGDYPDPPEPIDEWGDR